jgi:hypothetical protein
MSERKMTASAFVNSAFVPEYCLNHGNKGRENPISSKFYNFSLFIGNKGEDIAFQ